MCALRYRWTARCRWGVLLQVLSVRGEGSIGASRTIARARGVWYHVLWGIEQLRARSSWESCPPFETPVEGVPALLCM